MDGSEDEEAGTSRCSRLGRTIHLLRSYIVDRVKLVPLAHSMPCMREILPRIMGNKDNADFVANEFFQHLRGVEYPGKYQEFMQALKDNKYPLVVSAIEDGDADAIDEEKERLINLFFGRLASMISPATVSEELQSREIISKEEGETIRNMSRHDSDRDAAMYLINRIHCRKTTWYSEFLEVLWNQGHEQLVKDIDEKYYAKVSKNSDGTIEPDSAFSPDEETDTSRLPFGMRHGEDEGFQQELISSSDQKHEQVVRSESQVDRNSSKHALLPQEHAIAHHSSETHITLETIFSCLQAHNSKIEQAMSHITSRLEALEKKVDQLILIGNSPSS